MIYKGARLFVEESTKPIQQTWYFHETDTEEVVKEEFTSLCAFDLNDIIRLESYVYEGKHVGIKDKTWVYFQGGDVWLIAESFDVLFKLWGELRLSLKIHSSTSIKNIKFGKRK